MRLERSVDDLDGLEQRVDPMKEHSSLVADCLQQEIIHGGEPCLAIFQLRRSNLVMAFDNSHDNPLMSNRLTDSLSSRDGVICGR